MIPSGSGDGICGLVGRRLTCQLLLILSLCSCATLAQSQQPTSSTGDPQRGGEKQSTAPPINITVTTPQPSPESVARDDARQERDVRAQEDIRDFTWMLTVLAGLQAAITFFALLASIR